jgi:hypothetical protein
VGWSCDRDHVIMGVGHMTFRLVAEDETVSRSLRYFYWQYYVHFIWAE